MATAGARVRDRDELAPAVVVGSGGGPMSRAWTRVDGDSAIWWSQGHEGITWSPQRSLPGVGTSHGEALALF